MTWLRWVLLAAGLAALGYAIYTLDSGIVALVVAIFLILIALATEQPDR